MQLYYHTRDARKIKRELHLTFTHLTNYLTAEVVTNRRWLQKNYDHNFPDLWRFEEEEQYADNVHKEGDIAWVYLCDILIISEPELLG